MAKTLNDLKLITEHIKCDFCENDIHIQLFSVMRHGINLPTVICEKCALIFTNPQPTIECLDSFYEDYYHLFHQRKGADESYVSKSKRIDTRRINTLKQLVNFEDQGKKVLEIACGAGEFIAQLNNCTNWEVSGIEPGKDSHALCVKKGLNVEKINFEDFATDEKYDLIACFFAVDHLRSPKHFFQKCNTLLKDGGMLFIEIGNFNKPFKSYTDYQQLPKLFSLTPITLMNYTKNSGFEVSYYNEVKDVMSVVLNKTSFYSNTFIKTDIKNLMEKINVVDNIQKKAGKIPTWLSYFRSIKNALRKVSL